jgi:murein tripeptide amidase MpaA
LTITDPLIDESEKVCIVAVGRIHPGESNASFVMKGFLDYLVSDRAVEIRKKAVFKIIPMINPDGVVFGNYRTSLSGKDLNRQFKTKNVELFP